MKALSIQTGDCLAVMPTLEAESVDAIVTDPPYGLAFMGKAWDHGIPGPAFWEAAIRVAKPGALLVAFGGTRTFHRLTCAIEDAGWEIRDCLSWLYGSGFPKSHNGAWGGTALKPAWEPITLARKPLVGTVAANVAAHGTGGLNVEACRIGAGKETPATPPTRGGQFPSGGWSGNTEQASGLDPEKGRWPANVALDEDAGAILDEQSGELTSGANPTRRGSPKFRHSYGAFQGQPECVPVRGAEMGGASRFYYCAKASRAEREAGLGSHAYQVTIASGESVESATRDGRANDIGLSAPRRARNHHPTVKPVALMRWLCRLVTPPGGTILDPFAGSGTTGIAARLEGFRFLGIEREPEYSAIAEARIAAAINQPDLWGGA